MILFFPPSFWGIREGRGIIFFRWHLSSPSRFLVVCSLEQMWFETMCDMTCKNIQCTQKFSSTHTGEEFIIYCNANYKTENSIYLLECAISGFQYIVETKQQLSKRLNGHRSDANCKPDLPFSRHPRSTDHHDSFCKLKVIIINHNPKWDDKSRQERKSFWNRKLKTLSPNGINEKK